MFLGCFWCGLFALQFVGVVCWYCFVVWFLGINVC